MHGGTQTVRFWGLQHVHWGCEGSCCCFLRLQSRLVWDVPKALQGRQGMCGSLAGWFQVAIQAVDWFVPEQVGWDQGFARSTGDVRQPGRLVSGGYPGRRLVCSRASSMYWFKVSFLRGVVGFWCMVARKQSALGGYNMSTGGVKAHVAASCAAKQVGLRCSEGFARSTGDVRQPGRLVSGGYPGRRLVCSRASSMYWFKVSFLRGVRSRRAGKIVDAISKRGKGKHLRKLGYI